MGWRFPGPATLCAHLGGERPKPTTERVFEVLYPPLEGLHADRELGERERVRLYQRLQGGRWGFAPEHELRMPWLYVAEQHTSATGRAQRTRAGGEGDPARLPHSQRREGGTPPPAGPRSPLAFMTRVRPAGKGGASTPPTGCGR